MTLSLDDLMADLNPSKPENKPAEEIRKDDVAEVESVKVETEVKEPEPAKKRGRPRKAKTEEVKVEEPEVAVISDDKEDETSIIDQFVTGNEDIPDMPEPAVTTTVKDVGVEIPDASLISTEVSKDIYILNDSQIIDGHVYHRGQKITFTKGDKFYQSQTDRNGNNWLDYVNDIEAQYAYFGKQIVEADQWSGVPIGSLENINHPGLALAINKFAREEFERNGRPFN